MQSGCWAASISGQYGALDRQTDNSFDPCGVRHIICYYFTSLTAS